MTIAPRITRRAALGGLLAAPLLPRLAEAAFAPVPGDWRRFRVTTRVEIPRMGEALQVWVPVPSVSEPAWQRPGDTTWTATADHAARVTAPGTDAELIHATWAAGDAPAVLTVTSAAATRDRSVDLDRPSSVAPLTAEARAYWTAATELLPTDGIVRDTAMGIVDGAADDRDAARRIYDWVVESTERNPETRGCGLGDIASMLAMGDLTGKCADLNALYVGLARAAGLPARDVYGLRVAPSAFGYSSLGAKSSDVTKAQHCRAEVWLSDFGWVPVDPADVRKVALEEEKTPLTLTSGKVRDARAGLFGAWEGNWIGLNFAHDVALPGAESGPVPFLMYPMAEEGGVLRDELDPAAFAYTITVEEL